MRIAVTGTTGRVGAALVRHFSSHHEVIPLTRDTCDLTNSGSLAASLDRLECDVFINPAGITSLEMCEDDPALAIRTNAEAPREIAAWAAARSIPVFHFSTDYVFSGETQGLRSECDPTSPLSVYGRSKLAGEEAVLAWPGNCVVRVSWVFGPEKPSFVDLIYENALAGRPLAAIADKWSLPVFTGDLCYWMERLIETKTTGIIHASQSGEPINWHDLASAVVEEMVACGVLTSAPDVREQTLAEMTAFRAPRPRFTAMDTRRLTGILGHPPRHWRETLAEYICSRSAG
jgi:dTDP-4-dehydrorhamnose reductase